MQRLVGGNRIFSTQAKDHITGQRYKTMETGGGVGGVGGVRRGNGGETSSYKIAMSANLKQ